MAEGHGYNFSSVESASNMNDEVMTDHIKTKFKCDTEIQ